MLSLEECRKILGTNCPEKEYDLELLRNDLYILANIIVDEFLKQERIKKEII